VFGTPSIYCRVECAPIVCFVRVTAVSGTYAGRTSGFATVWNLRESLRQGGRFLSTALFVGLKPHASTVTRAQLERRVLRESTLAGASRKRAAWNASPFGEFSEFIGCSLGTPFVSHAFAGLASLSRLRAAGTSFVALR
jgi:hypothetical protein